jgi:hypothetical protein
VAQNSNIPWSMAPILGALPTYNRNDIDTKLYNVIICVMPLICQIPNTSSVVLQALYSSSTHSNSYVYKVVMKVI